MRTGTQTHTDPAEDIDRTIDETEIGWLLTKRAAAVRAKDAEYLVAGYAPGALVFEPASSLTDRPRDLDGLRGWFAGFEDSMDYAIRDLAITVGGDTAFCHSLDRLSATPVGGRRFQAWFRTTVGMRRIGGRWVIAHEHRSTP